MSTPARRRVGRPTRVFDHLRPGARALVLTLAFAIVLASAFITAQNVSDHLTRAATKEAILGAESIVRGYVEPLLGMGAMSNPGGATGQEIDRQLGSLVGSDTYLLRVKIWAPNGTVLFSDLPALRGLRFDLSDELKQALAGENATEITTPDKAENAFEEGLADEVLEIYLPIRDHTTGNVIGAYEVYQDATPLLAAIGAVRRDVLAVALGMATVILLLLYLAFAGTWARLVRVNRSLRRVTGEVRDSEARFRSLIQNSGDVFAVLDPRGRLTYQSVAVQPVLGYRPGELTASSVARIVHPDDRLSALGLFREVLAHVRSQRTGESRLRHADGSWRVMEWTLTNLVDDPSVGGVVLNARDISQRKALEEQLSHQALHDPLTDLANRALFSDRVEHALERRDGRHRGVAVLFLDLDDFKTVNDSLGHGVGDHLLVAVAERLRAALRPADTVARMGGDEFAILVDEPVTAGAPAGVAERVLDALGEPFVVDRRAVRVRASIGIAWSQGRRTGASDLLRDADVAMYAAKRRGKGRYEVFQSGMRVAAVARMEVKADLDRALANAELVLDYQPIVDLHDGRVVSVEALARWNHPTRGLLGPEWFISLAEDTGQIVPLGRWVVAETCRQAAVWRESLGRTVPVAINLSARELQDPDLVAYVGAQLKASGVDPASLTVEVTESVWVDELETSGRVLTGLRALGVHLAIDDFGIGYSSLSYLQRFPFDSLKIDRSFVSTLSAAGSGEALVRSIVDLGKRLDREVVAEGIEQPDQLAILRRLGCRFGQGYLLARPAPAAVIEPVLRRGLVDLTRPEPRVETRTRTRAIREPSLAAKGNGQTALRAGQDTAITGVRKGP